MPNYPLNLGGTNRTSYLLAVFIRSCLIGGSPPGRSDGEPRFEKEKKKMGGFFCFLALLIRLILVSCFFSLSVASSLLQCSPTPGSIRDGMFGYNCCTHTSAPATPTNQHPPVSTIGLPRSLVLTEYVSMEYGHLIIIYMRSRM